MGYALSKLADITSMTLRIECPHCGEWHIYVSDGHPQQTTVYCRKGLGKIQFSYITTQLPISFREIP